MANNVRVWPAGLGFDGVPGSANLTLLDIQVSTSVSGTGGTYAPVTPIILGGAGVQIAGPFEASDVSAITLGAAGAISVPVGSQIILLGTQIIPAGGIVQWQNGSLLDVDAGATMTVDGTVTFAGATNLNGTTVANSAATFNNTVTHTAQVNRTGANAQAPIRVSQIDETQPAVTLNTDADLWWVFDVTPAGTTTYTLKSSSPTPPEGAGLSVQVYAVGIGQTVEIRREDASLAASVTTGNGGVDFRFLDGGWRVVGIWGDATTSTVF